MKKKVIQLIIGLLIIGALIYVVKFRQSGSTKSESAPGQYNTFTIPAK
jgi:hypothetical protein